MQNLHLVVSTAKPEGSSGGENEEQKRGVVVGAVHPSAALARQRVTALDILKGFNASTEYEVHSVYMQRLWHNTPFSSYRTIFTSNVDRTATRSSVILVLVSIFGCLHSLSTHHIHPELCMDMFIHFCVETPWSKMASHTPV